MTPNTIEFHSTDDDTWVMRITADRKIEVNEDVDVTFAAQKVLDALQVLLTPQCTWVELTHEEIDSQAKKDEHGVYFALGALWAEAKLKEENT